MKLSSNKQSNFPQNVTDNNRLIFLDNIRVLLTILVVTTHLAITYGPAGPWVYYERSSDSITNFILTMFFSINLAFLIGCFFIISGNFVPKTYDQKGALKFLINRWIRLGIPGLLYFFILAPTVIYIEKFFIVKSISVSYWTFLTDSLLHFKHLGVGPLWFVFALLIFLFFYVLGRLILKPFLKLIDNPKSKGKPLSNRMIFIFTIVLTLIIIAIRVTIPKNLSFSVKLSYILKYIGFFIFGIMACRRKWFQNLTGSMVKIWSKITVIALLIWPIMFIFGGGLNIGIKEFTRGAMLGNLTPFFGGMNWQTICYSVWETIFSVGACISLFYIFQQRFNYQGKILKTMSLSAYTVYVIHTPIIVLLSYGLRDIQIYPLLKFILVSVIGVSVCFLVSHYVILRLPGAKKIL